ncbi:hypothetical protein QN367_17395, partial [Cryobacterium sp. RTS3]|uniref:hypothetical protein n=1 Tax=Cryobacterium sp. RTS3 TaxID=3048643 RepID=UPI002B23AC15
TTGALPHDQWGSTARSGGAQRLEYSLGLIISLVGVQVDGLSAEWALAAWLTTGIALASLLIVVLLLARSFDEEDGRGMKLVGKEPLPAPAD